MQFAPLVDMTTCKLRILLILLATALPASEICLAGSTSVVVNGRSYHLGSDYDWNENNTGLGIEYQLEQRSAWRRVAMANGFRDSAGSMSYMAGFGIHRRLFETNKMAGLHVYAGLNAFLMTRKDMHNNRPFPGLLPSLSVGNKHVGMNLTYLPREAIEEATNSTMVDPGIKGIVFLQLKMSLDRILP